MVAAAAASSKQQWDKGWCSKQAPAPRMHARGSGGVITDPRPDIGARPAYVAMFR